jgi:hypothetical protein
MSHEYKIAKEWMKKRPNYKPTVAAGKFIGDFLQLRNMKWTFDNLDKAFDAYKASRKRIKKPRFVPKKPYLTAKDLVFLREMKISL